VGGRVASKSNGEIHGVDGRKIPFVVRLIPFT
jgi:hypothetical protein